jgi:hypothetical protein
VCDGRRFVAQLEQAASDLVSSLRIQRPVPEGEDDLQERHDVQVLLHSTEDPMTLRKLSVRHRRIASSSSQWPPRGAVQRPHSSPST